MSVRQHTAAALGASCSEAHKTGEALAPGWGGGQALVQPVPWGKQLFEGPQHAGAPATVLIHHKVFSDATVAMS